MNALKSGSISSLPDLNDRLTDIYSSYSRYSWEWCSGLIAKQTGTAPDKLSADELGQIILDWKINAVKFNNMIMKDAEKEFDSGSKLGYGIDGDEKTAEMDFQAVRGKYEENKFVLGLQKEIAGIEEKADTLIAILKKIQ